MKYKLVFIVRNIDLTETAEDLPFLERKSFCSMKAAEKEFIRIFTLPIKDANNRIWAGRYVIHEA
jgi:hypothetical protein